MNLTRLALAFVCCSFVSVAPAAMAAPTEYPMTGPIISMTDTTLVVQQAKTKATWEFTRTADTKVTANLKVGDLVTVRYTVQALSVEPKAEKTPKPSASPAATGAAASTPTAAKTTAGNAAKQ